ncbi:uncharacterized protein FIBRA_08050 [Fibroporia radiculosa]|uniref:Barwin domain-containing protein n=1 Tax=Fibroporia radiculosa TaxID=599839 RepID=J4IC54_9APHY|nr:uncharacterized protein FIBRA_08050 [Fibroporia radiculosa]CCM05816.1 predicted protein [Fibroporia radiculosa]
MARFALLCAALVTILPAVFASPVAESTTLDKRVTHEGWATWYDTGLGACGYTDSNSDPVVAISHLIYGSGGNCNQASSQDCVYELKFADGCIISQWMEITYNGITQYGKTRDECEACGEYDIDLSPSLFEGFAALSVGQLEDVEWHFMNKDWSP